MLFSNKDIFKIIIPILIEQLLAIAIGMLDSVMVSAAGESAVSGVSLVDSINILFMYFFTALAGGGAIVIAQLFGKNDVETAEESSKQLLYAVTIFSIVIATIAFATRRWLLKLVFGKVEADVMKNALDYFNFTLLSYPFIAISSSCSSICRAQGNTKTNMCFSIIANLINLGGNAVLIYGFHMGAKGAAIATLVSRAVGAILIFAYTLRSKKLVIRIRRLFRYKPNFAIIKRICAIGVPNGVENCMFQFGRVMLVSLVSGMGTASIAANAVANSLTAFQYAQGNAVGLGVTSVVGKCVGAGEKKQAKQNTKKLILVAYAGMLIVSLLLCCFSGFFIGLYNLSEASTTICRNIVYLHSAVACLIWPFAFVLPNAFRASNDIRYTLIVAMIAMWVFRVGLSYLFAYAFDLGVYSIWLAMFCDWVVRIIFFVPRFIKGTWLEKYKYD